MTLTETPDCCPFTGKMSTQFEVGYLRRRVAELEERVLRGPVRTKTDQEWARLESQLYVAEKGLLDAAERGCDEARRALHALEVT